MSDLLAHPTIRDMFVLSLPILEKVLRPVLVYTFLVVALRLAGKRALAQINTFDLVVLLMLSNTVQNAIIGEDNSVTGGLIGAASLLLLNSLVVRFLFYRMRLDRFLEGQPTLLIEHGKPLLKNMQRELITETELKIAAHRQGFRSLHDIDRATLETGGSLAFFPKDPSPMQTHHDEVLRRLDEISRQIQALQQPNINKE